MSSSGQDCSFQCHLTDGEIRIQNYAAARLKDSVFAVFVDVAKLTTYETCALTSSHVLDEYAEALMSAQDSKIRFSISAIF